MTAGSASFVFPARGAPNRAGSMGHRQVDSSLQNWAIRSILSEMQHFHSILRDLWPVCIPMRLLDTLHTFSSNCKTNSDWFRPGIPPIRGRESLLHYDINRTCLRLRFGGKFPWQISSLGSLVSYSQLCRAPSQWNDVPCTWKLVNLQQIYLKINCIGHFGIVLGILEISEPVWGAVSWAGQTDPLVAFGFDLSSFCWDSEWLNLEALVAF